MNETMRMSEDFYYLLFPEVGATITVKLAPDLVLF